jgi:hypothetical protein
MNIYVDRLFSWGPGLYKGKDASQAARVGSKNDHQWCHLFADESDCQELHAFALRCGLKRIWFQGNHYDLTPLRREKAVKLGAIEVDRKQAVLIWRKARGLVV